MADTNQNPGAEHPEATPAPALAADWNSLHPVGTLVTYWPGERTGRGRISRTRTPAWVVSGQAVVSVDGHAGGIALTHVDPVHHEAEGPEAALLRDRIAGVITREIERRTVGPYGAMPPEIADAVLAELADVVRERDEALAEVARLRAERDERARTRDTELGRARSSARHERTRAEMAERRVADAEAGRTRAEAALARIRQQNAALKTQLKDLKQVARNYRKRLDRAARKEGTGRV